MQQKNLTQSRVVSFASAQVIARLSKESELTIESGKKPLR
jgi:hypothetical protein